MKLVLALTLLILNYADASLSFNNDTTFNESSPALSSGEFKRLSPEDAYNAYRTQETLKNAALKESLICKFISACVRIREHNTQEFALFKHLPLFQGKQNDEKWALYVESGIHTVSVILQPALNHNKSGEYLRFGRSMIRSREIANAHAREDNRTVGVLRQYRERSSLSIFEMLRHESKDWLFTRDDIDDMNLLISARQMGKLLWKPFVNLSDTEYVVPLESSMKCYVSPEDVHSWVQANREKERMNRTVDTKEEKETNKTVESKAVKEKERKSDKKIQEKVEGKEGSEKGKKEERKINQTEAGKTDRAQKGGNDRQEGDRADGEKGNEDYRNNRGNDRREGGSYRREGGNYRREGGNYRRDGGNYRREGGNYRREGGSYRREGGNYRREGGNYRREGGNYRREGGNYRREGGNYRREGGNYRREGGNDRREGEKKTEKEGSEE